MSWWSSLRVMGPVVGLAVVVAGVIVYLASGPAPPERYTTTPDPCALVGPTLVRTVVGDVPHERTDAPSVPYSHDLRCDWQESPENPLPHLLVRVSRYEASRGIGGADHARAYYEAGESCRYHLIRGEGEACGEWEADRTYLRFTVVQDNVTVTVAVQLSSLSWSEEEDGSFPWGEEETFERLAREVLTMLEDPEPAPTP